MIDMHNDLATLAIWLLDLFIGIHC